MQLKRCYREDATGRHFLRCYWKDVVGKMLSEKCFFWALPKRCFQKDALKDAPLAAVGKVLLRDVVRKVLLKRCSSLDAFGKGAVGKMQPKRCSERCFLWALSERCLFDAVGKVLLKRCYLKDANGKMLV